ncbi:MAG: hypothetical protein IJP81_03685 [Bacteroidales bacterium]|nr:hypothetical protein [Bacteroidales bacterium]
MIRKSLHIVLMVLALMLVGCTAEHLPLQEGPGMKLTVRCESPIMTKGETTNKDGEKGFNENLIQSVDFFFYTGKDPDPNAEAVYHVRRDLLEDSMVEGFWEVTFNLVVKKDILNAIFPENSENPEDRHKATVYALVNFDKERINNILSTSTSMSSIAQERMETDFAQTETNYLQPSFLMDGKAKITYVEDMEEGTPDVTGEINVKRLASKLTMAIHVASRVELQHREDLNEPNEIWAPVLHTMRIYLVDGVKTVKIGGEDDSPEYFTYKPGKDESHMRPFLNTSDVPYFTPETVTDPATSEEKVYYNTWPMYSYPAHWTDGQWDYSQGELTHEQPYIKLEMDWRREAENGYSYDRRKYYYKIFMPFNSFKRNNWYGFYLDVSILGSETDEGKAILMPSCYLMDWQNKALAINKYAVISKARYLSVEKRSWEINNLETLSVPFLSSHNVDVVEGTVTATRPYYGEIQNKNGYRVNEYNPDMHAWIRENQDRPGTYYLQYHNQGQDGNPDYEPCNWLTNTSTSIVLNHPLQNHYDKDGFDYSPYTIEFDINHSDLLDDPESHTYSQYLRHITITQYPAIYIEATRNSDTAIKKKGGNNPYGYDDDEAPWLNKPWGYVYVNGGRFVRWDNKSTNSSDPFFQLETANNKREYQWQSVWYTGGSQDIFNIHVTVLPSDSKFVIGDPREDDINNLDRADLYPGLYEYTVDGSNPEKYIGILEDIRSGRTEYPDGKRTGFNEAKALYGDSWRRLRWYYPTEKSTRTENMLAPSYRIASKFGGTEYGGSYFADLSKTFAEYRCAAYQEDGFPAGRWRLPTKAEINFIAQLSAKGAFEFLFGSTVYWSAQGAVLVNQSNGTVTSSEKQTALLRCVYDSWYWDHVDQMNHITQEGEPRMAKRDEFVWGDKER